MDEVASGLFVGTVVDAGNESVLRERGVTAIVSLTHCEPESGFPSDVTVVDVPMMDGPQNEQSTFRRAVTEVLFRLDADDGVLVHCSAGASRSPAVAATTLALQRDIGLDEAFRQVSERRPVVDPHDALVRQAARVCVDLRG